MKDETNWLEVYKVTIEKDIASQHKGQDLYDRVEEALKFAKTVLSMDDFGKLEEFVKERGYLKKKH